MNQTELIPKRLDGKIAVITGGNSGIGLATAQHGLSTRAQMFRSPAAAKANSMRQSSRSSIENNVTGVQGDVFKSKTDLDRLYDTVKQQKGRIDVLFANAGIVEVAVLGSITDSHFDKMFNINAKGLLFTVQKSTSAVSGWRRFYHFNCFDRRIQRLRGASVYTATKAAIRSFARTWTVESEHRKIRVNAISPGPTDTSS